MAWKPRPNRYGRLLRNLIKSRHVTQHAFANRVRDKTGVLVSQSKLSQVINGILPVPQNWVTAISDTFGVSELQRKTFAAAAAFDHGFQVDIPEADKMKKAPEEAPWPPAFLTRDPPESCAPPAASPTEHQSSPSGQSPENTCSAAAPAPAE